MVVKNGNNKINLYLVCLYLLAFLRCTTRMYLVNNTIFLSSLINIIQYIVYTILLVIFIQNKHTFKELLIMAVMVIVGIVILIFSGEALFLTFFLVIGAKKNEKVMDIFQALYKGLLIAVVLTFFCALFDGSLSASFRRNAYSLGFVHPNVCGYTLVQLVLLKFAISKEKIKKDFIFLFLFVLCINIFLTDSRTSIYLLLLIPIVYFVVRFDFRSVNYFIVMLPIILFSLLLYAAINFEPTEKWLLIDSILNGRLTLNSYNYYKLGVPLLGQKVTIYKDYIAVNTIDCAYIMLLLGCGILGVVVFLGMYVLTIASVEKDKNFKLLTCIVVLLISGVTENSLLDIITGFPLIYFGNVYNSYIKTNRKTKRRIKEHAS